MLVDLIMAAPRHDARARHPSVVSLTCVVMLALSSLTPARPIARSILRSTQPAVSTVPEIESDAQAGAAFTRAEGLRAAGQCAEAIDLYEQIAVDRARTVWAGRAALGTARCLVALGRGREAMPYLQRVRAHARELTRGEAEQALRWNTVLARLYLRDPRELLFTTGAPVMAQATRLRDVIAIAAVPGAVGVTETSRATDGAQSPAPAPAAGDAPAGLPRAGQAAAGRPSENPSAVSEPPAGLPSASDVKASMSVAAQDGAAPGETRIAVLTENAYLLYDVDGRVTQSFAVQHPRGLLVDATGVSRAVTRGGALTGRASDPPFVWRAARGAGSGAAQPLEDVAAACGLATGEVIVADRRSRSVYRFAADGAASASPAGVGTPFAAGAAQRCAASERGDVALLDRDSKTVTVLDAAGKPRHRLIARGEGYQFIEPIDLDFDPIGDLYVLDRAAATVWMFDAAGVFTGRLVSPAAGEEAAFPEPTAMTVDAVGRVWIYDAQLRRVVMWQ